MGLGCAGNRTFFETVGRIARVLQRTMKTDWVVADVAGLGVAHAHVHVVPRFPGDGHGECVNPENAKTTSSERMKVIAETIRNDLSYSLERIL